jgi:hypothetical protein
MGGSYSALGGDKYTRSLSENLKGKDLSEELDVDGRTILKWILKKYCVRMCIGFIWFSIGTGCWIL